MSFGMGTIFGSGDRPREGLTPRARIRDAALAQFAEHGIRGASMRWIAEAAGVSLGLVQHHFGTKEALREAFDEAVVGAFRRRLTGAATEDALGEPAFLTSLYETVARCCAISRGPWSTAHLRRRRCSTNSPRAPRSSSATPGRTAFPPARPASAMPRR